MGTLEFHFWGSRIEALDKPDRGVFDLDPDESVPRRLDDDDPWAGADLAAVGSWSPA